MINKLSSELSKLYFSTLKFFNLFILNNFKLYFSNKLINFLQYSSCKVFNIL